VQVHIVEWLTTRSYLSNGSNIKPVTAFLPDGLGGWTSLTVWIEN